MKMKVVQIGNGILTYMTALAILKKFPDIEITIIEEDRPVELEATVTGQNFRYFNAFLGIDENEFLRGSRSTYNFGNFYYDFLNKGETFCHVTKYGTDSPPFQYPHNSKDIENLKIGEGEEALRGLDWSTFANYTTTFLLGNRIPALSELIQGDAAHHDEKEGHTHFHGGGSTMHTIPLRFLGGHGYNLDPISYYLFLRAQPEFELFSERCTIIESKIKDIKLGDNGIEWVTVEDSPATKIKGDLFIDCSGNDQVLIKEFGDSWEDLGEYLPNNRAITTHTMYENQEEEMTPFSKYTGMSSGWMWTSPNYESLSHGYVYSDNYISPDWAEEELQKKIKFENPVTHLLFKSGFLKRSWIQNCIALGSTSLSFEPLEFTTVSIYIDQIMRLLKTFDKGYIKQLDRDLWNNTNKHDANSIKHFITTVFLHTEREDTPYWKDWKYNRSLDESGLDLYKWLKEGNAQTTEIGYLLGLKQSSQFYPAKSYDQIMSSMGATDYQNTIAMQYQNLKQFPDQVYEWNNTTFFAQEQWLEWQANHMKRYKHQIKHRMDESPNHYDYLTRRIYA